MTILKTTTKVIFKVLIKNNCKKIMIQAYWFFYYIKYWLNILKQVLRVVPATCKLLWPCLCLARPLIKFHFPAFMLLQIIAGKLTDLRATYFLKCPLPLQSHFLLRHFFLSLSWKFPGKTTTSMALYKDVIIFFWYLSAIRSVWIHFCYK